MEKVKLTDICRPKQWKTISGDEISKVGKYPVYGANGKMGFFHEYNHIDETLLIGCRGTCGTLHITEKFSYTNGNAMALDNLDKKANIKFLYYFFSKRGFNDVVSGGVQKQITIQNLQRIEIPLPSIAIQQKIAAILDQADAIIQNNRAIVQKYDALTQSLFLDMFGDPIHNLKKWAVVKFSEVGNLDRGKSKHRPRNAPELLNGPYPLIQTGDVANSGGYIKKYKSTYSELGLQQSKMWPKGTLCITIAANIANTGILTFDACFPDSVVGFVPNDKTNNIYVQNWMSFLQEMIEEKAPMAAQKNINLAILRDLEFMNPPIELQNQFAERVAVIEAQKQQAQLELAKSEELFASLLQRAFKGELN